MEHNKTFHEIIGGTTPVLVDFSADWCGPCKMMQPILKDLAGRVGDDARILKVDVDRNPSVAQAYQITSVPTLILFRQGKVLWRRSGILNATQLEGVISEYAGISEKNRHV